MLQISIPARVSRHASQSILRALSFFLSFFLCRCIENARVFVYILFCSTFECILASNLIAVRVPDKLIENQPLPPPPPPNIEPDYIMVDCCLVANMVGPIRQQRSNWFMESLDRVIAAAVDRRTEASCRHWAQKRRPGLGGIENGKNLILGITCKRTWDNLYILDNVQVARNKIYNILLCDILIIDFVWHVAASPFTYMDSQRPPQRTDDDSPKTGYRILKSKTSYTENWKIYRYFLFPF
jgi:hypothetical protein